MDPGTGKSVAVFVSNVITDIYKNRNINDLFCDGLASGINGRIS